MSECRFSVTPVFLYQDRIVNSVLIRKNKGQRKPIYRDILCTWNKILSKVFCTVFVTSTLKESKPNGLEQVVHAYFFFVDFLCWVNIFVVIRCHRELIITLHLCYYCGFMFSFTYFYYLDNCFIKYLLWI